MSETLKIFLTALTTIIGGVLVYVSGQILSKFFIEPIHEQRRIIGEIADALIYYANIYMNPGSGSQEKMVSASEKLRQLATLLQSKTHLIPHYSFFEKVKIVHKSSDIESASGALIGLSNSIPIPPDGNKREAVKDNKEFREEICKLLNLRIRKN